MVARLSHREGGRVPVGRPGGVGVAAALPLRGWLDGDFGSPYTPHLLATREARDRTSASVNLEHIVTSEWLRTTESVLKEAGLPRQDIAVCTLANASENSARGEKPLSCFGTDADLTNSKLYHPDETRSKAKRTRLAKATCHGVLSITFVQQDTKSLGSKAITGHFMAFLSTRVGSPGCGGMPPRSRAALRAGLL